MGAGKTVTVIALAAAARDDERAARADRPRQGGTLVVAPKHLLHQWDEEKKKFVGDQLRTLIVYDVDALSKMTEAAICEADIVIAAADLLADDKNQYLEELSARSGVTVPKVP